MFVPQRTLRLEILSETGAFAGYAEGRFDPSESLLFHIQGVRLRKEYRTAVRARTALLHLMEASRAERFLWRYPEPSPDAFEEECADPFLILAHSAAEERGLRLVRTIHGQEYNVDLTALPPNRPHDRWNVEACFRKRGVQMQLFSEASGLMAQIAALGARDEIARQLSPLRQVIGMDGDLSYVLAKDGVVMGWIVSRRKTSDTAEILRAYIMSECRGVENGAGMLCYMLRRLLRDGFRQADFYLRSDNKSARRFYPKYFGPALHPGTRWFVIEMEPEKEKVE